MTNNILLNIPIQINGSGESAAKPSNGYILPRELYITRDGKLYYGDPASTDPNNTTVHSVVSNRLFTVTGGSNHYPIEIGVQRHSQGVNTSAYNSDTDETEVVFRFGHFRYIFGENTLYCNYEHDGRTLSNSSKGKIKGLKELYTDILSSGKLIVGSSSYGDTLPATGAQGQLFFKVLA